MPLFGLNLTWCAAVEHGRQQKKGEKSYVDGNCASAWRPNFLGLLLLLYLVFTYYCRVYCVPSGATYSITVVYFRPKRCNNFFWKVQDFWILNSKWFSGKFWWFFKVELTEQPFNLDSWGMHYALLHIFSNEICTLFDQ